MSKKVAVILSGCGVYDGAEIHESVITLLRLDQRGATVECFAPDIEQLHVIDHLIGQPTDEVRNVRRESARIARGNVRDVRELNAEQFDALIMPGGFGVAKNLSNFALVGAECSVQADVLNAVQSFAKAGKPVGLMCISPALAAHIYGAGVVATLGAAEEPAGAALNAMGGVHQGCAVEDIVEDAERKLITTPAYMRAESISQAATGINKLVDRVLELA